MFRPLVLLLCCPVASAEYQLNLCWLVVAWPLVTLPSCLSLHCTASCCATHLPSRCTSWLLHCLLSSSRCAAPLVVLLRQLVVTSPLLVLLFCLPPVVSLHQLVLASPLVVLLLRRPLVLSSRWLVVALPLNAPPTSPLVAPPFHPLSMPADCPIAYWMRCRHCSNYEAQGASGNYKAWGVSGDYKAWGASGGKYKARMVIFCLLAAVKRFSWISPKEESL